MKWGHIIDELVGGTGMILGKFGLDAVYRRLPRGVAGSVAVQSLQGLESIYAPVCFTVTSTLN